MPYKVLLVDDEPLIIEALKRALRREPYEVHSAGSAREALEVLAREPIDIVVSDEMMPGMPGSELMGVVCGQYPETIRIILTGHPNLDTALRAINKGHIYRFLIKPCDGNELSTTIKEAIEQKEPSGTDTGLQENAWSQQEMLAVLEQQYPGITKVQRDSKGTISVTDEEYDLDALIEEIERKGD
jgi:DNA-binding NtrC family response regulator